ncbi:putative leucine-rich repeat domain superfamily [Dioscorea sansibarensis]
MRQIPSLVSLCVRAVAMGIIDDGHFEGVFELPDELLDSLAVNLPPLALQGLHEQRAFGSRSIIGGNKRQRYEGFDAVWKALFKERWPENFKRVEQINKVDGAEIRSSVDHENDWQQLYWETHLQNCLDEAAERAMLPAFDGHIGELSVSDSILNTIGYSATKADSCLKLCTLWLHCNKFGQYARCLRLQNVLCVPEISGLLVTSNLRALVFRNIKCKSHVDGVCDLLRQNRDTLKSLEFVHCRFSSTSFSQICSCIFGESETHGIKSFSIKSSCVTDSKKSSLPANFVLFLSSGRSLESIHLSDTSIGPKSAKLILDTLLKSSLNLITLEISDKDIRGWLSKVDRGSGECSSLLGPKLSLKSLSILNLRGCNLCQDDAEDLNYVLIHMPNLTSLDLSDNPLEDEGISRLIPYFVKAFEKTPPLLDVNFQNCNLSCKGVTEFLESSQTLREPLNSLSVAENNLCSSVAAPLAIFLGSPGVKALNIEAIGLEPLGFQELGKKMPKDVPLGRINISKNRGGSDCASFISKLIMQAPDLVVVDAGYNFILPEALMTVHDALNHSTRKLWRLDLTGNVHLSHSVHASKLLEYHVHGQPIVIIPSELPSSVPYDDDP